MKYILLFLLLILIYNYCVNINIAKILNWIIVDI